MPRTKNFDIAALARSINVAGNGDISFGSSVSAGTGGETIGSLTASMDSNQTSTITLTSTATPVPIVQAYKEVGQPGLSSKGSWDVNANATNYDFFDEKPISYSSVSLTPSATGDGTFLDTSSGYSLSASSFGSSFNVGSQAGNPQDVVMKTDGTKMYVLDVTTKTIFEYDLSTNFDSSTATYNSVNSGSLGTTVVSDPYGLRFKPDGTKLYICAYGDVLYQFSLGTAWDLSTISADTDKITSFSRGNIPYCFAFKPDGTKVYTVGYRQIYEYVLPTAWSLSGAIWTSAGGGAAANYLSFGGYINPNSVTALDFSADGTKFFIRASESTVGTVGTGLFEVPMSSAWDPCNSTQDPIAESGGTLKAGVIRYDALDTAHGSNNLTGFAFVNNGQQAVVCYSGAQDYVYTLNTLAGISFSSSDVGKKVVGNSGTAVITSTAGAYTSITPFADTSAISSWQLYGAEGKSDGTGIVLSGYANNYNIANATYTTISPLIAQSEGYQYIHFKPDGTKVWVGGGVADTIFEYDLSTGFDLSTITYSTSFAFASSSSSRGFFMKSDGTRAYISNYTGTIYQLDLSTAWDISTATYNSVFMSLGHFTQGFYIKSDGTKLYNVNEAGEIKEFTLNTPWDISNTTLDNTVSFPNSLTNTTGMFISKDGTKIFVTHFDTNRGVSAYSLSTAWDTSSTITFIANYATTEVGNYIPADVSFNSDGSIMYVIVSENTSTSPGRRVLIYATGSSLHPYSQYSPALTNSSNGQINSSTWLDINSMTADETKNDGDIFYAVSTDNRTSWGVAKGSDGVRKIARNNSGTWQYNNDAGSATYYDFSNPTSGAVATSFTTPGWTSLAFNTSGDRVLLTDDSYLYSYPLNTSWDISTIIPAPIGTSPITLGYSAGLNAFVSYLISDDGTKAIGRYNANGITYEYSMSTPFDVTTLSLVGSANLGLGGQFYIKPGTYDTFYVTSGRSIHKYTFTGGSITTGTLTQDGTVNLDPTNTKSFGYGQILFKPDGTEFYITQTTDSIIEKWTLGTAWDITTATKSSETAAFSGIGAVWLKPDGTKIYYIDTNNSNQLSEINIGGSGYSTSETWVNGTNNNEYATLQQALTSQSFNRMNKAQLDAVADGYHFSQDSADTLDLMIAPYAASGASPVSDGVTINYDAESFYRQASPGVDYIADFIGTNRVDITSNISANLKIKVV